MRNGWNTKADLENIFLPHHQNTTYSESSVLQTRLVIRQLHLVTIVGPLGTCGDIGPILQPSCNNSTSSSIACQVEALDLIVQFQIPSDKSDIK